MTAELTPNKITKAIQDLKQLNIAPEKLCSRCDPLKYCQFRESLIGTENLGQQGPEHFRSLLKPHNGNFHSFCASIYAIETVVNK